tara:strand:+ start:47 stop:355 length:309 start_codon:yes stop_codon:yes gene_type:complete
MKSKGKTYHILVKKNLNETIGIVEVEEVIKIQNKYNKTNKVMGCLTIGLNDEKSYDIFQIVITINPKSIGSVGNAMSKPRLEKPNSDKEMEKGVNIITAYNK